MDENCDEILEAIAKRLRQGADFFDAEELSASETPELSAKFKRWLLKVDESLPVPRIEAGENISLEEGPGVVRISAKPALQRAVKPAAFAATADYPFKTELSAGVVVVHGYNEDEGRFFRDYATFGLTRLEVAEKSFSSIGSDSWIYLDVTANSSNYLAELKSSASLPDQSKTEYIVPVAYVKTSNGVPSEVFQMQYGPVEGSGRIF